MSDHEALTRLLRERSVAFGDFVLASGARSSFYVDARRTTMSARGLGLIGTLGLAAIRARQWSAAAIGGLTMGADPVAYAVALASLDAGPALDAFSVRKAAKGHGTGRLIEGNFAPGARVVIAEDVITSGASSLQAIDAVRGAGGIVVGVLAVVDRLQGGADMIRGSGLDVVSLTTITDLIPAEPG